MTDNRGSITIEVGLVRREMVEQEQKNSSAEMHGGLETQLRVCKEELERLTYNISHDLRAPLRAIQGFTTALLEDYSDKLDETGKEFCRRIKEASWHLDSLLQDILDYSRIGRPPMEMTSTNLYAVVRTALAGFEEEIRARGAVVDLSKDMPPVVAHAPTLVEVIKRLISNSLKFVAEGDKPVISIDCEKSGEKVRIKVKDRGIGIPESKIETVFDLFERIHGAEYGGNGAGLAIAKKGVDRMGGSMGVQSDKDSGTLFWIELEAAKQESKP